MGSTSEPSTELTETYPTDAQTSISKNDLNRFLKEKWKPSICEVCQEAGRWGFLTDGEKFSMIPNVGLCETTTVIPSKSLIGLNIVCRNCGNLKVLIATFIKKWINENPEHE